MNFSESYVPVEADKVSGSSSAETPMELLNDAARKRQAGIKANKTQEANGKGAMTDLAGFAYSMAKYNLTLYQQAQLKNKTGGADFLTDQKKYLYTEILNFSEDDIREAHNHLRHFADIPEKSILLTASLLSQFVMAQFIAYTMLTAYDKKNLLLDDFLVAAQLFTGIVYQIPKDENQIDWMLSPFYQKIKQSDPLLVKVFATENTLIQKIYALKSQMVIDFIDFEWRDIPYSVIKNNFEQAKDNLKHSDKTMKYFVEVSKTAPNA